MSDHPSGHEERTTNVRGVFLTTLIASIILVVLVYALYHYFVETQGGMTGDQALKTTVSELPAMRRAEDSVLNSYGVINATTGTFRIPIEQAMRLMAVDSSGATSVK
jgi:hypothetical protein